MNPRDVILRNPFRILALPINASVKEITRRVSDLLTQLEIIGKTNHFILPQAHGPSIDVDLVREAKNLLESPQDRAKYSLFWFWNADSVDNFIIDEVLRDGNYENALRLWIKRLSKCEADKPISWMHNIAVTELLLSLNTPFDASRLIDSLYWHALSFNSASALREFPHVNEIGGHEFYKNICDFYAETIGDVILENLSETNTQFEYYNTRLDRSLPLIVSVEKYLVDHITSRINNKLASQISYREHDIEEALASGLDFYYEICD